MKLTVQREESPTLALISKLSTWETVVTLRKFVCVLYQLGRHDISNPIIDFTGVACSKQSPALFKIGYMYLVKSN